MTAARRVPLTAAQVHRADAVIAALSRVWPACFQVYEPRRRPLAIGIDKVVIEQMAPAIKAGRISEADIKMALRCYVGATGYLRGRAIIGNPRIGLDGQAAGPAVTEADARSARRMLAQRSKKKLERNGARQKGGADEQPNEELFVDEKGTTAPEVNRMRGRTREPLLRQA